MSRKKDEGLKEEKMKHKFVVSLIIIGLLGSLLSGCGSNADTNENDTADVAVETTQVAEGTNEADASSEVVECKHKLAASIPLNGNLMQYGISYKNALEMAVEDFNASNSLPDGKPVILEIFDDQGDQKEAINIANKIISDEDVIAVIGSFGSSVSMAAAPVYQKGRVPMISPNTSHVDFPGMGDLLVPISPTSELERSACADVLYNQFGGDLAILHQNTDLGLTGGQMLKEYYEELGGDVIMVENFVPSTTKDFTPILSKIKAENPSILYIDGEYPDVANIIIQINEVGLTDVQVAGPGNVFKKEFLDIVGDKADGTVFVGTTPVYLESIMNQPNDYSDYLIDVANRYNEKYTDVFFDGFAACAYDAAMMAMHAAVNVGTDDPDLLVQEMVSNPIEITSGGEISYFDHNRVKKNVFMYTVKDGEFQPYLLK